MSAGSAIPYIGCEVVGIAVATLIVVAILIAVLSFARARARCRREERLQGWAAELGLKFAVEREPVPDQPYGQFSVFDSGMDQYRLLTICGQMNVEISGHAHSCEVLLGDIRQIDKAADVGMPWWLRLFTGDSTHEFSYLLLHLPFGQIPAVRIRHRFGPGGFGAIAGWEMLATEWAEFNRTVQVATRDRRFANGLIGKRMMEFLVDHAGWPISIEGEWMCITDAGSKWTTTEYRRTVEWLHAFVALWPEHLVVTMSNGRIASKSIR